MSNVYAVSALRDRLRPGLWLVVGVLLLAAAPLRAQLTLGGYLEEAVEETVEESVEESVEETVAETIQETIEEAIEEEVEARSQLTLGGYIEAQIEESVEEAVEESVEEVVEEAVEEVVEQTVEEAVEDNLELAIEESIEDAVEVDIEEAIEENIEEAIEESVEVAVEESVESAVEESVEVAVEESVEESVEVAVEESVEQSVEVAVEESVEVAVEDSVEQAVEVAIAAAVEDSVEAGVESGVEESIAERIEDSIESEIENKLEADNTRMHTDQWLVMAEPEVFEILAQEGYIFDSVTELPGMGLRLAEVAAPASYDMTEVRQGVMDVIGRERADIDLNHLYTAGSPEASSHEGIAPRNALQFPADIDELPLRIGMIDSLVDVTHPSLNSSRINSRSFTAADSALPDFHGTAIASIIAANTEGYVGLAPKAELYAAAVFEQDRQRGEIASTFSLVKALDWLITEGVDVINISLAGPPNRLLETALKRAAERNVLLLAAAGNGGPVARPMYPAAYSSVVAVTAVNSAGTVFRLANRGNYLDLAAPGVDLLHARAGGGYASSSGTSFAVPFATTAAAWIRQLFPTRDVLEVLYQSAQDLGAPGRDDIYGHGLLRPGSAGLPAVANLGAH
jgi:hypothetical protein